MNLLLLTFGDNTDNHQQAVFAALSFMRDPHIRRVLVVTDRPDFYRWLCGTERNALLTEEGGEDASGERGMAAAVEILPITAETLSAWQGPQQFFWRIKIQAVAMAVRQYPDQHLLYVDSDTFLAGSLAGMVRQLDAGAACMHCWGDRPAGQYGGRAGGAGLAAVRRHVRDGLPPPAHRAVCLLAGAAAGHVALLSGCHRPLLGQQGGLEPADCRFSGRGPAQG